MSSVIPVEHYTSSYEYSYRKLYPTSRSGKLRNVRITDKISSFVITIGGIGTIIAILTVSLFLLWVAFPLLLPPSVVKRIRLCCRMLSNQRSITFGTDDDPDPLLDIIAEWHLTLFRLSDGAAISQTDLFEKSA